MRDENMAMLQALVCIAWADGRMSGEESEIIQGLLEAFGATRTERLVVERFAKEPRTLSEVPIHDLSSDDRRVLLQHAVLITFVDGEQHEKEKKLLDQLCETLRIPAFEAKGIISAAEERARSMLNRLH